MLISDTTIREAAQEHGAKANEWLRTDPAAVQQFRDAPGEVEFTADGTSVNTCEGWREMKVGIFSKRKRGESATPDEWATRDLPKPLACLAFAAIEDSESFGARWKAWCQRLKLLDTSAISVLADGAKWIWEEQRKHLTLANGVLDIFHVLEHVTTAGKSLYQSVAAATAWITHARETLLAEGWTGLESFLKSAVTIDTTLVSKTAAAHESNLPTTAAVSPCPMPTEIFMPTAISATTDLLNSPPADTRPSTSTDPQLPLSPPAVFAPAALALRNYLAPHAQHLNYAERLAEGRSIGSGQIEGACKNLIGRRLKANSARWRVRRVNRMAGLCSLMYSDQWAPYWQTV